MKNETQGKKQVIEAGVIALVSALAAALATWAVDEVKAQVETRRKKTPKKRKGL